MIVEISSYFCISLLQLNSLTWRTLNAIHLLGEFSSIPFGIHEILYSYYFASLFNKNGVYHICSSDGQPIKSQWKELKRGFPLVDVGTRNTHL